MSSAADALLERVEARERHGMRWNRDAGGGMVLDRPSLAEEIAELAALEQSKWKGRHAEMIQRGEPMAADTPLYVDVRSPKMTGNFGQITLAATSLMVLNPVINWSTIAGYWDLGKRWRITIFGKFTTGITPGNLTVEIRYGTTDAGGTILATSAATALTASKTDISWSMEVYVRANAVVGTAAGLFAWGWLQTDMTGNLLTNALQPLYIPASAAAAVNVDTTAAGGVNVQMKRSGSTGELLTVQDLIVEALN